MDSRGVQHPERPPPLSIFIAYIDEDQLTLEDVTYKLGPPGKGGVSWDWSGEEIIGEGGITIETLRFPE
ncbi:hypothetical protein [Sorangium sp. So ce124]|uniref:hypothetical protein n=1 Tax=Sorangium sp. So ce124 TaxID=3133280 RepID=UPI003F5FF3E3